MTIRKLLEAKGWSVDEILDQEVDQPNPEQDLMIDLNFSETPNVSAPVEIHITCRDRSTDHHQRVQ